MPNIKFLKYIFSAVTLVEKGTLFYSETTTLLLQIL